MLPASRKKGGCYQVLLDGSAIHQNPRAAQVPANVLNHGMDTLKRVAVINIVKSHFPKTMHKTVISPLTEEDRSIHSCGQSKNNEKNRQSLLCVKATSIPYHT